MFPAKLWEQSFLYLQISVKTEAIRLFLLHVEDIMTRQPRPALEFRQAAGTSPQVLAQNLAELKR